MGYISGIHTHMLKTNFRLFPHYTTVENNPRTKWISLRREVFDYPFFGDGATFCKEPFAEHKEFTFPKSGNEGLKISGFIFHTSHCGSTLLSRMFSRLPGVRVVSETEAINGLLLSHWMYELSEARVLERLKVIIDSYRQPFEGDKYLIFKTTSWNVYHIHFFQKLYPEVPWIYLDRDTEKAVESSLRDDGGFVQWWDYPVTLMSKLLLYPDQIPKSKKEYVWKVMENQRSEANRAKSGNFKFFNYPDFIESLEDQVLPHFGMDFTKEEVENAKSMTNYESKHYEKTRFGKVNKK